MTKESKEERGFVVCCHLSPTLDKLIFFKYLTPFFRKIKKSLPLLPPQSPFWAPKNVISWRFTKMALSFWNDMILHAKKETLPNLANFCSFNPTPLTSFWSKIPVPLRHMIRRDSLLLFIYLFSLFFCRHLSQN